MREFSLAVFCDQEIENHDVWVRFQNTLGVPVSFLNRIEDLIHFCVHERPSVLFLDFGMTGVKGLSQVPRVLREHLDIETICFSSLISPESLKELDKQPPISTLRGPLELKPLLDLVNPLLYVREKEKLDQTATELQNLERELSQALGIGFGAVKVQDLEVILKEKRQKRDQQLIGERKRREEQLLNACEEALKRTFASSLVDTSVDFKVNQVQGFIVELMNYRGFLCLASHLPTLKAKERSPKFPTILHGVLEEWGVISEVTGPFQIKTSPVEFVASFSKFSEFLVHHRKEDSLFSLAFLKRESTRPSIQRTEDEEMLRIDIKSVPPLTTVPFDCFLLLPKNKKYVRYIKAGCQITLEQVKRHSKNPDQSHLYVPASQENLLLGFLIQQSLDWELALESQALSEPA